MTLLDIENVPKVNEDGNTYCEHCKDTVDFGTPCARHEKPGRDKPTPPLY
jgi:hypothetical protein